MRIRIAVLSRNAEFERDLCILHLAVYRGDDPTISLERPFVNHRYDLGVAGSLRVTLQLTSVGPLLPQRWRRQIRERCE